MAGHMRKERRSRGETGLEQFIVLFAMAFSDKLPQFCPKAQKVTNRMKRHLLNSDIAEIVARLGDEVKAFSGRTVLLTGGRGFLGRYFMEVFGVLNRDVLDAPVTLVAMDNMITAGKEGAHIPDLPNVEFVQHDVVQPFEWDRPLDYVIHAAGIASPYYYRAYPSGDARGGYFRHPANVGTS